MASPKPAFLCCVSAPRVLHQKDCELVAAEFEKCIKGRPEAEMSPADFATFLMHTQCEKNITEISVATLMADFKKLVAKSNSSRHFRIPGLSFSSRLSRSSRLATPAPEQTSTPDSAALLKNPGSSHNSKHSRSLRQATLAPEQPPTFDLPTFLKFLWHPNFNGHREKQSQRPTDNMGASLSDYYISASHNTYLRGNQLIGQCSTEPISKALREGCRVIELDCWNGAGMNIDVLHGGTWTKPVSFEECVTAIKKDAFQNSKYPVIVTIENHLDHKHQKRAAKVLHDTLGAMMFIPPATERPPKSFRSPEELMNCIIISDKPPTPPLLTQIAEEREFAEEIVKNEILGSDSEDSGDTGDEDENKLKYRKKILLRQNQISRSRTWSPHSSPDNQGYSSDFDPDFDKLLYIHCQKPQEMVIEHVKGGPLKIGKDAIMANLSESQLKAQIKNHPDSLIEFSKVNLSRVYPFGLRIDSSNGDPMCAWEHGVQIAAINWQGCDWPVWISKALFGKNSGCGYIKKPNILLPGSQLDHRSLGELIPRLELKVKFLMGHVPQNKYASRRRGYFVRVAMHGMHGDKRKDKTPLVYQSPNPNWENWESVFQIRVPELAILRVELRRQDKIRKGWVGQCCVPVTEIKQGIRTVTLASKKGDNLDAKLLCYFETTML